MICLLSLRAIQNTRFIKNAYACIGSLLELADVVTASTRQVLEGVWSQGLRIKSHKVIPNYIDNRIWPMEDKRLASNVGCSNKIRVLYAGTETHDGDLRIIEKALPEIREQVMRDCKKSIEIVVVGGTTLNFDGMEIMRVPDNKRDYPTFSNGFNR